MDQDQVTSRGFAGDGQSDLNDEIGDIVLRAKDAIEDYAQKNPHAAVGIAAAVGFVLGGGLTPRRLIRLAFAAGGPLISRQISTEIFKLVADALDQPTSEPPKPKRKAKRAASEAG
jgi:hypothetical protein